MSKKQFSMHTYWNHVAQSLTPLLSFEHSGLDFDIWHTQALAKLRE
jgi:hypothetical protein